MIQAAENRVPTPTASCVFAVKAALLRVRRAVHDYAHGIQRWPRAQSLDFPHITAESRTPLWTEDSLAERALQEGKVQNLRCAIRRLNGAAIPAEQIFSFWKQIGRASARRGYVPGRQLRDGCIYPAVGGGLCQLSNALYSLALQTGADIVERHPHSQIVSGSAADGRDATISWNYIDLRFRPAQELLIEAQLTQSELVVRFRSKQPPVRPASGKASQHTIPLTIQESRRVIDPIAHSCATCGMESCFRHKAHGMKQSAFPDAEKTALRTACLVDVFQSEFQDYLNAIRKPNDVLGIPLDGTRWRQPRYRWECSGYASVDTATWQTLQRAVRARRLGRYGAARLTAQLESADTLASQLAHVLRPDTTHVCVSQSLLPFLWRDGHLGGRSFEVLMTRMPLYLLQTLLDEAAAAHPERHTLREFRAPQWVVEAEAEALKAAVRVVTPHAGIAAQFPEKSVLLEWKQPVARSFTSGTALVFPGPTAARKGAYELRAVARALDLEIVLLGSELEGEDFWAGVRTRRVSSTTTTDWRDGVGALVQPALLEDHPRLLLEALAAGISVIATAACGLGERSGVVTVPFGNEAALSKAIHSVLHTGIAL